jgi:hypothetical protein
VAFPDHALEHAQDVARTLLGSPVEVWPVLAGGRNSRIYRVRRGHEEFALKQYPASGPDRHDRLTVEVGALQLMECFRLDNVARVVGVDRARGYALLTWINGAPISQPCDADVDAALAFLATIHALRRTAGARALPLAAEACLAGVEIERQVQRRLSVLKALPEGELLTFLENSFVPAYRGAVERAKRDTEAAGLDFAAELPQEKRSLVPSDFGFHNSLRRPDGTLAFFDFEYFGWDDPVKLTADILLHPGVPVNQTHRRRFRLGAERLYGTDPTFVSRLRAYVPLFAMRWTLILLNEFVPERWHRRVLAGVSVDWEAAKRRQLALARDMISSSSRVVRD